MSATPTNPQRVRQHPARVGGRHALLLMAAVTCSLVTVLAFIGIRSTAAFSATTSNSGSSFTAGTVVLTDDDTGSALFSVSNMAPGDTSVACITVTYSGTVVNPAAVRLYTGGYTDSGTLSTHLNLTIEEGTGGSFGDCTGFSVTATIETGTTLSGFAAAHTNYANGAGAWDPSGTPESRTYRFTVELDSGAPNTQQGASVTSLAFTWEVQS